MAKIMIKLAKPLEECSATVQQYINTHNTKFDKYGYASAPEVEPGDHLYREDAGSPINMPGGTVADFKTFYVPNDPDVLVYYTTDNGFFYTEGLTHTRKKIIHFPTLKVSVRDNNIRILKRYIIRGTEVVDLVNEVLYDGPLSTLPERFRELEQAHYQAVRERMEEKELRLDKARNKVA